MLTKPNVASAHVISPNHMIQCLMLRCGCTGVWTNSVNGKKMVHCHVQSCSLCELLVADLAYEDFAAMAMKERLPSVAHIVSMLRFGRMTPPFEARVVRRCTCLPWLVLKRSCDFPRNLRDSLLMAM